jgi:hypothetical protein
VEFVVDKVALGQVFSEYFGFLCQSSFYQFLFTITITYLRGWYNRPVSDRSTQSLTPLIKKTFTDAWKEWANAFYPEDGDRTFL